jgi:hypothetical protein
MGTNLVVGQFEMWRPFGLYSARAQESLAMNVAIITAAALLLTGAAAYAICVFC